MVEDGRFALLHGRSLRVTRCAYVPVHDRFVSCRFMANVEVGTLPFRHLKIKVLYARTMSAGGIWLAIHWDDRI